MSASPQIRASSTPFILPQASIRIGFDGEECEPDSPSQKVCIAPTADGCSIPKKLLEKSCDFAN